MKGLFALFLGIFGTFAFSWVGLIFVPNIQIGHLNPQTDEDGNDPYPSPRSGMAERGHQVYVANGCVYCHSQQIRAEYAASDIERRRDLGLQPRPRWGDRRSAPRDYIFDRPVLLGKMRMGPDLANIGHAAPATDETAPPASPASNAAAASPVASASPAGSPAPAASPVASASPAGSPAAAVTTTSPPTSPAPPSSTISPSPAAAQNLAPATNPPVASQNASVANSDTLPYSAAWHHRHLYNPRDITLDSDMPAYRFLYEARKLGNEVSVDALSFSDTSEDKPAAGWEIVPTYDAQCLVAYLMSLDQSHPLKEVKASAPATPPASAQPAK